MTDTRNSASVNGVDIAAEGSSDVGDEAVTDVMTEDEIVHVPPAAAELAESLEHHHDPTFVADVPDWDEPDPLP
jgi:hypothetical protein